MLQNLSRIIPRTLENGASATGIVSQQLGGGLRSWQIANAAAVLRSCKWMLRLLLMVL